MGITVDASQLGAWAERMNAAASGALKNDVATWWDAQAIEFLNLVQGEVMGTDTVDTGRLLNSFAKGATGNVFNASNGGLTIQVGTNVEYAPYVENGHHQDARFVPGSWGRAPNGKTRFNYGEGHGGMMLKEKWITGKFFFQAATRKFREQIGPEAMAKVAQLIRKYMGG